MSISSHDTENAQHHGGPMMSCMGMTVAYDVWLTAGNGLAPCSHVSTQDLQWLLLIIRNNITSAALMALHAQHEACPCNRLL
jgi:hypothetical protein